MSNAPGVDWPGLAKKTAPRAATVPAFGAALREAREAAGFKTTGQVVLRFNKYGDTFRGMSRSQLSRYERGLVTFPDPAVLYLLGEMYGADVMRWIRLLTANRQHVGAPQLPEPDASGLHPEDVKGMRINDGGELELIKRYRAMNGTEQLQVLEYAEFVGKRKGVVAQHRPARNF